jgi:hypothetical protein
LTGTYYLQRYKDSPDTLNNADATFPGFPAWAHQNSYRTTGSSTLRSTLSDSLSTKCLRLAVVAERFLRQQQSDMFTNQTALRVVRFRRTRTTAITNAAPGTRTTRSRETRRTSTSTTT